MNIRVGRALDKELFDYDSVDLKEKTFKINSNGALVLKKDTVRFVNKAFENDKHKLDMLLCKDERLLMRVNASSEGKILVIYILNLDIFSIDPNYKHNNYKANNCLNNEKLMWTVAKQQNNSQNDKSDLTHLLKNDVIKLGKIKLFVANIIKTDGNFNIEESPSTTSTTSSTTISSSCSAFEEFESKSYFDKVNHTDLSESDCLYNEDETSQCRVCFSKECSEEDPLISLCNCTGSVKYIHYSCLESWVAARATFKEKENVIVIKCKFFCEICKTPLPARFTFEKKTYKLIEDQFAYEENKNYLILESIDYKATTDYFQYFYFVTLDNEKEVILGRDKNSSSIKLKDKHSSRTHAAIVFKDDRFFIYDKKSKFGTLILDRKQIIKIDRNMTILQIGNVNISVYIKIKSQKLNLTSEFNSEKNDSTLDTSTISSSNYLSEEYESILTKIQYLYKKEECL